MEAKHWLTVCIAFQIREAWRKAWESHEQSIIDYLNSVVSNCPAYAYVRIYTFVSFVSSVSSVCSFHLRRANLAQRVYVFCDPAGCRFHHLKLFTSEWSMATGSKHHETSERHAVILALWMRFHPFLALETVTIQDIPRPQKLNSTTLSRPKTWLNQSELPMGTCTGCQKLLGPKYLMSGGKRQTTSSI